MPDNSSLSRSGVSVATHKKPWKRRDQRAVLRKDPAPAKQGQGKGKARDRARKGQGEKGKARRLTQPWYLTRPAQGSSIEVGTSGCHIPERRAPKTKATYLLHPPAEALRLWKAFVNSEQGHGLFPEQTAVQTIKVRKRSGPKTRADSNRQPETPIPAKTPGRSDVTR
jgi:hypothetical protein